MSCRNNQLQVRQIQGVRQLEYRTVNGAHDRIGPAIPDSIDDERIKELLHQLRQQIPPKTHDRRVLILALWRELLSAELEDDLAEIMGYEGQEVQS